MATVTAELRDGTAVALRARGFSWPSDEPVAAGGTDTGPDPYEVLLGGLASCIAITLRLYADHKGIDLTAVDVQLDFDRVDSDDFERCAERTDGVIERIRSEVTLYGSFNDAERARLGQVARRCPVHKTLERGLTILDSVEYR